MSTLPHEGRLLAVTALLWGGVWPSIASASPLHLGAMRCDLQDVQFFIGEQHAPADDLAPGGVTPLLALAGRRFVGSEGAGRQCAAVVRYLLQHGAKVDAVRTPDKKTALHLLAEKGDVESVTALLEFGAVATRPDAEGNPPIFYAGNTATIELLVQHGASLDARSTKGNTALMVVHAPEAVRYFLDHGVSPSVKNAQGLTALVVQQRRVTELESRLKSNQLPDEERKQLEEALREITTCVGLLQTAEKG